MIVTKIMAASIVLLGIISGGIVGVAVAHEHETAWIVGLIVGIWAGVLVGCFTVGVIAIFLSED